MQAKNANHVAEHIFAYFCYVIKSEVDVRRMSGGYKENTKRIQEKYKENTRKTPEKHKSPIALSATDPHRVVSR